MPRGWKISPELWLRAEALFDRLMEAGDPEAVLREVRDPELVRLVRRLWENERLVAGQPFLETLTLVRHLTAPADPCFHAGQVLAGRFTVEGPLGAGGMGEVYAAYDPKLKERVALKTIRRDLAANPAIARRFLAEVQNARRVTHANVCRINELFDEAGTPFFTMQYLEGVRLSEWLLTPGPEAVRRRIALELAEGLAAAHRAGIVHCDFKPANVILTGPVGNPTAVITDFGLARAFGAEAGGVAGAPGQAPCGATGGAVGDATTAAMAPESTATIPRETAKGPPEGPTVAGASRSLRGGTRGYMAPEIAAGAAATVRSDIYSYGKVLGELLPGHRLAGQCAAVRPQDRPETLDVVVRALGGGLTRRLWIAGGAVTAAGVAAGSYGLLSRPRFVLASRQRVAVNGFRPDQAHSASVVRDLLVTALRQSPLLMVMGDDRVRALLRTLKYKPQLPADAASLLAVAAREGALAIEGAVDAAGHGLRLLLQVFPQGESKPALRITEEVDDPRQVVKLADRTALRLRRELGESAGSLARSVSLAQVTSSVPEAVEVYFQGIGEYEQSRSAPALALFDEAIQLDSQFAMAHLRRGLTLAASDHVFQAIPSYEQAFTLRKRLPDRERLWIESRYYHITGDDVSSLQSCRELIARFPEEATFQRSTAIAMTWLGRPGDALPYNKRAVELDPSSVNNASELVANHVEASRFDEALTLAKQWQEELGNPPLLQFNISLAYLGLEDYPSASSAAETMARTPEMERDARLLGCEPLIMTGQFAEAASRLASDLAWDIARGEERLLQIRRVWLAWLALLMDDGARAREQIGELARLEPSPAWLQPLRECGLLAEAAGDSTWVSVVLDRLREIERRWPSTQSKGARANLEGVLLGDRDKSRTTALFGEAKGLWADPLTLYSLAQWQQRQEDWPGALATLEEIEGRRGAVLRRFFPGMVVLSRMARAKSLAGLSRFKDSLRLYERVRNAWLPHAAGFSIMRRMEREYQQLLVTAQGQGEKNDA
jgi:tetratricopeptide (TPR) repeat protein/tRNA A-37 threonylcarbamoyl transferase component Bud32